jgi:hypothetical protein
MQKATIVLSIFVMFVIGLGTLPAQTNFTGTWVLDKSKTHNLPSELKGYTMAVTQSDQQLVVETKLEGDLGSPGGGPPEGFPGGGGPPGAPGGGPPEGPGVGGPPPGGPGGFPGGGPPSGLMALSMVIPNATYSLEGKETVAMLEGRMSGSATLKAKWAKDKKSLELTAVRHSDQEEGSALTTKEVWTMSKDGEVLNLQRTVETPFGTDRIKLTFNKEKGEGPKEKEPEENNH